MLVSGVAAMTLHDILGSLPENAYFGKWMHCSWQDALAYDDLL